MELFAEFKFDASADPFIDSESHIPNKEFEWDTDAARLLRGQLSSYVAALSGSQFRIHVFTILIFGRFARLMFWDRNGAVVSRAFDYTRFNYIGLFLQQYDQNVDRRRHDPSVTISSQRQFSNYDLSELKKDTTPKEPAPDPTQLLSLNPIVFGDTPNEAFSIKMPKTENVNI